MVHLATPSCLVVLALLNAISFIDARKLLAADASGSIAAAHGRVKEVHVRSDVAVTRFVQTRPHNVLLDGGSKIDATSKARQDLLTMLMAACSVLFVSLLALVLLFGLFVTYILGDRVKKEIESVDQDMLGTDVEVQPPSISLLSGRVAIRDVKILNPAKSGYLLKELLTIESIDVNVCVPTLLRSLGGIVKIKSLVVKNVHVNVEKHSIWSSNVKEISDFLSGGDAEDPEANGHDKETSAVEKEATDAAEAETKPWLSLNVLKLQQMSVTFQTEGFGKALTTKQLELADICYNNFDKESGGQTGTRKIVKFLLNTVLMNARKTVGL